MPVKWIKTKFKGVRYYEHHNRKHGVKFDRSYAIRYQRDGKRKEECLGWSSEGISYKKATEILNRLKKKSRLTHDITLLSLYTGMRFREIALLKWHNVKTLKVATENLEKSLMEAAGNSKTEANMKIRDKKDQLTNKG
jgi:hypothetical protein